MYLPLDGDESIRSSITHRFKHEYCNLAKRVGLPHGTVAHWGKLEMPTSPADYVRTRVSMERRYPVEEFNAARRRFDPKNLLGNRLMDVVFGSIEPEEVFKEFTQEG